MLLRPMNGRSIESRLRMAGSALFVIFAISRFRCEPGKRCAPVRFGFVTSAAMVDSADDAIISKDL